MSNSETKNNNTENSKNTRNANVQAIVKRLLSLKNDNAISVFAELEKERKKHGDEALLEEAYNMYIDEFKRIEKIALKIKKKLLEKYPNLDSKEYVNKVLGYQKHYNFSDSDRKIILRYIYDEKNSNCMKKILENFCHIPQLVVLSDTNPKNMRT